MWSQGAPPGKPSLPKQWFTAVLCNRPTSYSPGSQGLRVCFLSSNYFSFPMRPPCWREPIARTQKGGKEALGRDQKGKVVFIFIRHPPCARCINVLYHTQIIRCFSLSWLINGGAVGAELSNAIDSLSGQHLGSSEIC